VNHKYIMSVLFFDSFDHYTNNTPNFLEALQQEYTCNFLFHRPYLLTGRYSNHALYLGSLGVGNYVSKRIEHLNETTFLVMGFQFKKVGNQNYTGLSISFAPIPEIYVSYEYDIFLYNKILFHNDEFKFITLSETSPAMATINDEEWHHVEMKMYYPGIGTWAFYVDGVQTGTWTPTTTIEWNKTVKFEISTINPPFTITEDVSKGWYIDDFYILDSFGSSYNNIIGPTARIETLLPTQDVVSGLIVTNSTNGYESQNNIPFNKTQFVKANYGSELNSTYEYENLSRINDIGAVRQNTFVKVNDNINYRSLDFAFLKNNQQVGPSIVKEHNTEMVNNSKSILLNTNPDTNNKWLKSELNSSNFGIKSKQYQNMQIIACKDASTSDLYYPSLTDNRRFNANAYILMIRSGALTNPNSKIWETVSTGTTSGVSPNPSANFMLVKKKLNGLETDTMIAAQQSVTNHTFAIIFVTDWYDDEYYGIYSITDASGNQAFPSFDYDFSGGRLAVSAIRMIIPLSGTSVSSTTVIGPGLTDWTPITLSFSKLYYLNNGLVPRFAGDTTYQTYNELMTGITVANSSYMNITFQK
jgi:hypothetical protein